MKKLLYLIPFIPVLLFANPRDTNPTTPDQVWQNDLDLRDMINSRISLNGSSYCIDNPTFCVDADNDQVEIGNPGATLEYDSTNFEIDVGTNVNISGDLTLTEGATFWTFGIDGDDSDELKISQGAVLGTNDFFTVTLDGEINHPLQPAFIAKSSAPLNVTGAGGTWTLAALTESVDQGGDYNNSNYTFTSSVDGLYQVNASCSFRDIPANATLIVANLITSNEFYRTEKNPTLASADVAQIHSLTDMDANDTFTVEIRIFGGASDSADVINNDYCQLSASLLH